MEDRYLFKAKRVDNGEWVQGVPFEIEGKTVILIKDDENILRVHYLEENMWEAEICAIEVDTSTICQCTGLKDKNGKLIWENDIVNAVSSNSVGEPICVDGIVVNVTDYDLMLNLDYSNELECVGNKFDKAELLESEG